MKGKRLEILLKHPFGSERIVHKLTGEREGGSRTRMANGEREELQPINVASHIISCSIQAQRKFPLRLICCCVI